MTPKERVLTTFANCEADRIPVNYASNPGIDRRLKEHFGLQPNDSEGLYQALGVDFRGIEAPYTGPKLYKDIPERDVIVDNWGVHRRKAKHETGEYMEYCDFPLQEADIEAVSNWSMPSPDDYDYTVI